MFSFERAFQAARSHRETRIRAQALFRRKNCRPERTRLKRAHGAYLKLATHGAEAAERAAMRPAPKIRPEKQRPEAAQPTRMQSYFK